MKKITYNKTSLIIILMYLYTIILLFAWVIPNFFSAIRFLNSIKYEIIGGYATDCFVQESVYYFSCNALNMIFFLVNIIFLTISIFKPKEVKTVGIIIIAQDSAFLLLQLWSEYFVNSIEDVVIINIKLWLIIVLTITGIVIWLSIKQKIFYLLLCVITILQLLNSITLVIGYIPYLYVPQVIFLCFHDIVLPILYWIFIIFSTPKNNYIE